MLIEIDVWLLGKLEKFSHWFQKLTGKNCFWLAKIAAVCHGLLIVVILMPGVFLGDQTVAIVSGILMMFTFFTVFKHFALIKHRELVVLREENLSNPFKVLDYDWRITILFVILLCLFIMAINLMIGYFLFYFSAMLAFLMFLQGLLYYFSACDPLPPAKSKVKEWKEKFVNAVKGVFAPAPQPSPVPCE